MDSRKLKPVCSLGMFDLLKGVAIIAVIVGHTGMLVVDPAHHPIAVPFASLCNFFLCGFIIAAGFGIHKRPVGKCAAQLKSLFLVPYISVASAAVILSSANDFFLYGSISSALKQGVRSLLRYLFAFNREIRIGGFLIEDCGALWFLYALAGGWFFLNLILNYSQNWKRHLLAILAGLIGYYGNLCSAKFGFQLPFCLFAMFTYVPLLYIGYLAKEYKLFEKKLSPVVIVLICLSLAAFAWKIKEPFFLGYADEPLGVFTNYAAGAVSFGLVYLMVHINRWENPVTGFFETIGRNSLFIYCVHAVEEHSIPWSTFRRLLPNSSGSHSFVVILIIRSCFIAIGMLVISSFNEWGGLSRLKKELSRKEKA